MNGATSLSALAQGIGQPEKYTYLLTMGFVIKFALNYVLVFGKFGLPAFGVVGCAAATAITYWILFIIALIYMCYSNSFQHFEFNKFEWPQWSMQKNYGYLGAPFGLGYWIEVSVFSAIAVSMSSLGTEALAASQVVSNFANLLFNLPLAISLAVAIQMGHFLGQGKAVESYQAGIFALKISAIFAITLAGIAWLFPIVVTWIYHPDANLSSTISNLLGLLIFYHLCDALQSVASFLNRAHKNAWLPALAYAICMWGIALNLGRILAFGLGTYSALFPGIYGFYVGQAVGLGCAGLMMWAYWKFNIVKNIKN